MSQIIQGYWIRVSSHYPWSPWLFSFQALKPDCNTNIFIFISLNLDYNKVNKGCLRDLPFYLQYYYVLWGSNCTLKVYLGTLAVLYHTLPRCYFFWLYFQNTNKIMIKKNNIKQTSIQYFSTSLIKHERNNWNHKIVPDFQRFHIAKTVPTLRLRESQVLTLHLISLTWSMVSLSLALLPLCVAPLSHLLCCPTEASQYTL